MLRPFIGDPKAEFRAFRSIHGSIFKELGRPVWRMLHDGNDGRKPNRPSEERRY